MNRKLPRTAAAEALKRILGNGAYSNIIIGNALDGMTDVTDRALCTRIVMTAVERAKTLDFVLSPYCRKKPDPTLRALLFTGASQILYMDRIPDSAACDETVKAAKELTDEKRAKFVNAVLRSVCRDKKSIPAKIDMAPDEIKYSVDASVISMLKTQYPEEYSSVLNAFFAEPPLFLRVNTLKISEDKLMRQLENSGCGCERRDGFLSVTVGASAALSHVDEGVFYVQGYASQYAVRMLDAHEGETVIDVCACPGGKTLGAAIDMKNNGRIYAFDIHENKLSLIEKAAAKANITIIETGINDGRKPKAELSGVADRVICDVPCSALGVIATRPEIRYKNVSDLSALVETQYRILCASAEYLKKGGTLVYSTCTFDKNENSLQIKRFMNEHGGFTVAEEKQFLPDGTADGFYCCKIIKND